jgi:hypothetical protein
MEGGRLPGASLSIRGVPGADTVSGNFGANKLPMSHRCDRILVLLDFTTARQWDTGPSKRMARAFLMQLRLREKRPCHTAES